nr:Chain G, Atg13 17BR [Lachancea thermotolerans CBS 6340]5JHF_G Chain G, Atg13 17BR [Lachancea thermotolerans]5JHF_H Chain H, Atg13 17BR [Lachancea thermotolerans]
SKYSSSFGRLRRQ